MNRQETALVLGALVVHYQRDPDDAAILVTTWERALADVPYPVVDEAVAQWLRVGKVFPTAAHIREICSEIVSPRPGADHAWALVLHEIVRVGIRGRPSLPPEVIRAVSSIGGWRVVCTEDLVKIKARESFLWAYKHAVEEVRKQEDLSVPSQEWIEGRLGSGRKVPAIGRGGESR